MTNVNDRYLPAGNSAEATMTAVNNRYLPSIRPADSGKKVLA